MNLQPLNTKMITNYTVLHTNSVNKNDIFEYNKFKP